MHEGAVCCFIDANAWKSLGMSDLYILIPTTLLSEGNDAVDIVKNKGCILADTTLCC